MNEKYNLTKDQLDFISFIKRETSSRPVLYEIAKQCLDKSIKSISPNALSVSSFDKIRTAHNPTTTAELLSSFTNSDGLKFLTHDFDPDSELTIQDIKNRARNVLDSYENKFVDGALRKLLNGFINGPEWIDYKNVTHNFYLNCEKLESWEKQHPQIHPSLSNEFGQEFQMFRNTVRVSKPHLPEILNNIIERDKFLQGLRIETEKLDKADFYTNVYILANYILRRVLRDIAQIEKNAKVKIDYDRSVWNEYRLCSIRITHIGSEANTIDEVIEKIKNGGGAMFSLLSSCNGYCDWTIEAKFEDGSKRWRILNYQSLPEFETLDENNVDGFSHIFTFYKK